MTFTIAPLLIQDGLTNGLIYALLALAILLVFVVTRVLWVAAGDFVVLGAITCALIRQGEIPGTAYLLAALGVVSTAVSLWRARAHLAPVWKGVVLLELLTPLGIAVLAFVLTPMKPPLAVQLALVVALVTPLGFLVYRVAFRPIADRPVLTLLFVAVAVHYTLTGLGLAFFGSEAFRSQPFVPGRIDVGFTRISWQLILVLAASAIMMVAFWMFFGRSLWGKALRATAVNRLGARLVGVRPEAAGDVAFTISALVAAISGILIGPVTALYYDSGFLIGLKGFIGTVIGGMVSFPLAVLGAVLVGLVESFSAFYASALKEAIVFALLAPFLLWRSAFEPRGQEDDH